MAANQEAIEKRLAEFTEVHGTVLLGMHRELEAQGRKVDDRLESSARHLHEYADGVQANLAERAAEFASRTEKVNGQLEQLSKDSSQRDKELRTLMTTHAAQFKEAEGRLTEVVEHAGRELADLLAKTRAEATELVNAASQKANKSLQSAIRSFEESFTSFNRKLEESETKIRAYMVKQQQLLDAQAKTIQALNLETTQLQTETRQKIEEHQLREAAFNRRMRHILLGLAIATSVAVILGVWKPWIS